MLNTSPASHMIMNSTLRPSAELRLKFSLGKEGKVSDVQCAWQDSVSMHWSRVPGLDGHEVGETTPDVMQRRLRRPSALSKGSESVCVRLHVRGRYVHNLWREHDHPASDTDAPANA